MADAPYRHEELAVMAVPDERLHADTLLEHHYGEYEYFYGKKVMSQRRYARDWCGLTSKAN